MKIRILDNTIRFRMSMVEIDQLSTGNIVASRIGFLTEILETIVKVHDGESSIDFKQGVIELRLNSENLLQLAKNDQEIGIKMTFAGIAVLFEKDFKCLTDRAEDESNLYPNPLPKH